MKITRYSPDDSPGFLIGQLANRMQLHVERALVSEGITAPQWTVLWILVNRHATTPVEISNYLSMDTGAVTRLLDRMVAKNLIARTVDEKDRRRVRLALTPEAKMLYPRLPGHVAAVVQRFFGAVSAEDLEVFKRVLLQALNSEDGLEK